jgi:hypothetical protein
MQTHTNQLLYLYRALLLDCCIIKRLKFQAQGEAMGKVRNLGPHLERGTQPPNDPLFVTLFPNPDDGSVTVVEPPVLAELEPDHRRRVYASCIYALEDMIQSLGAMSK